MRPVKIGFVPSASTDVVSYLFDISDPDTSIAFSVLKEEFEIDDGGNYLIDLTTRDETNSLDGTYTITIKAVDDAGNLSEGAVLADVVLDFLAPDAPSGIFIVRL